MLCNCRALNPVALHGIDGRKGDGFIAHEIQAEIVPDCVTGEKDAVNEDGTIKYRKWIIVCNSIFSNNGNSRTQSHNHRFTS